RSFARVVRILSCTLAQICLLRDVISDPRCSLDWSSQSISLYQTLGSFFTLDQPRISNDDCVPSLLHSFLGPLLVRATHAYTLWRKCRTQRCYPVRPLAVRNRKWTQRFDRRGGRTSDWRSDTDRCDR